jgi:DNA-binding MarR family transcriptional regulator
VPSETTRSRAAITNEDYTRLAAFRLVLRGFLHFSEEAAAEVGLTGQHYQALLILRGWPPEQAMTINDLAQQLFLKHNSAVGLVDRLAADGLLVRTPSSVDRRKVELRLTARGSRLLSRLAQRHHSELQRIAPDLESFFHALGRQQVDSKEEPRKAVRRQSRHERVPHP